MEITLLGYICFVSIILILLLQKNIYLMYAAVFFSGFSGSSVINVSSFSLQPSYLFFFVFLVFELLQQKKLKIRINTLFFLFILYCIATVIFPFFLSDEKIEIMNQDGEYVRLGFSSSNITQIAYLLFCAVFLNYILKYKNKDKLSGNIIKSFNYGFYAVVAICLYQIIAFRFNLPFDKLFRQSVHGNIQGTRIYGPCIEASMLCYYLITALIVVLQTGKGVLRCVFSVLSVFIGIYTYSSTYIVGAVLILLVMAIRVILNIYKKYSWKTYIMLGIIVLVGISACVIFREKIFYLVKELYEKLTQKNDSGLERTETMLKMSVIGLKYPLGVGFGSARSKDLLSTWLCNIGIFGVLLFLLFVLDLALRAGSKRIKYLSPFILVIILSFISVPEPYNLFIWFYLFYYYVKKSENRNSVLSENLKYKTVSL